MSCVNFDSVDTSAEARAGHSELSTSILPMRLRAGASACVVFCKTSDKVHAGSRNVDLSRSDEAPLDEVAGIGTVKLENRDRQCFLHLQ